jgi:peptidoglycan-N-acetylglucosamine deacetylase
MNILSFDIEDWYMSYDSSQIATSLWESLPGRIDKNLSDILDFLDSHNTRATFYIMGWVAERYPLVVKDIHTRGHEIGYHSYYHDLPVKQGPALFEKDLTLGLALLEDLTGEKVVHYRAPRFSLCHRTNWSLPILVSQGIEVSSSVKSIRRFGSEKVPVHPFYFSYQGVSLLEMPLNQASCAGFNWVFTGSGYFRIMPFWLISKLYHSYDYNMAYFHPRDFDTAVPKTDLLPFYRNIMSRLGNHTTAKKLSLLIHEIDFMTVGKAAATVKEAPEALPVLYL